MNIGSVVTKLRNGDVQYALGRFRTVRSLYGGMRRLVDGPVSVRDARPTLFPDAELKQVVQTIRKEAVFVGLKLPTNVIAEIDAFARSEPLHANYDPNGPTFRYADIRRGKTPDGRQVPIGGVRDPARCPAVQAVVDDPVLRSIVTGYLGH